MNLSEEEIKEFQLLYHRETGIKLTFEEAQDKASKLVHFVELALVPNKYFKEEDNENNNT